MTFARRRFSVAEAVNLIVLDPPLGHWWLVVAPSHEAALRVASGLEANASRHPSLPFARVQDHPDADLFLCTLATHPEHALILTTRSGPSPGFWRRLDKVRPRLRRAAPTILVVTEEAEVELRTHASHLSGWLSGQSLYVHDEDPGGVEAMRLLCGALCELYDEPTDVKRMCHDMGADWARIAAPGRTVRDLWLVLLEDLCLRGHVCALVDLMLVEYPSRHDAEALRFHARLLETSR